MMKEEKAAEMARGKEERKQVRFVFSFLLTLFSQCLDGRLRPVLVVDFHRIA